MYPNYTSPNPLHSSQPHDEDGIADRHLVPIAGHPSHYTEHRNDGYGATNFAVGQVAPQYSQQPPMQPSLYSSDKVSHVPVGSTHSHSSVLPPQFTSPLGSNDDGYSNRAFLATLPFSLDAHKVSHLPTAFGHSQFVLGAPLSQSTAEGVDIAPRVPTPADPGNSDANALMNPMPAGSSKQKRKITFDQYFRSLIHREDIEDTFEVFDNTRVQLLHDEATRIYNERQVEHPSAELPSK
jgi:hypothetical protein